MKKKLIGLLLVMTLGLSLCACGDSNDTKVIENTAQGGSEASGQASGSDAFYLSYEGMNIYVDQDASTVVDVLGEPSSYFESPSCAGEGIGKLYTYSDIEVQTYPEGDKDLILYVLLRTDNVSTNEGIDLSKTKDDVIATYGQPTSETDSSLVYEKGGMKLVFVFDGDSMLSIEYDSSKN